jgi:hypothetical protein
MKRYSVILVLLLLFPPLIGDGAGSIMPAYAESLAGASQDCGTYTWAADYIKGRADGLIVHVRHSVGCFTFDYENNVPADPKQLTSNPSRERAWQMNECQRWAREDVVGHFRYYRGIEIAPESIPDSEIRCTNYSGPD